MCIGSHCLAATSGGNRAGNSVAYERHSLLSKILVQSRNGMSGVHAKKHILTFLMMADTSAKCQNRFWVFAGFHQFPSFLKLGNPETTKPIAKLWFNQCFSCMT
jgi:hypothetical protein